MGTRVGRFGPAGIFSTDDPAADQRQIEAESHNPEEDLWEQPDEVHGDDPGEYPWDISDREEPKQDCVTGTCNCGWVGWHLFWSGDAAELEARKIELLEEHSQDHPECPEIPMFG